MKTIFLFVTVLCLASCGPETEAQQITSGKGDRAESYVTVYDFHMKHRCKTCIDIENSTKKVLKEQFSKEMADQKISFKLVDAEDPQNEALVEAFGAFGTTLAISVTKNGKREINDITPWAFQNSGNDQFEPELAEKIRQALGKL